MSFRLICFNNNEKRNLNAFFEHRMNSNRLKTTCLRVYRVACYLIEKLRILLNVKITRFSLL